MAMRFGRFLMLLAMFAVLLAPASMLGGHAAMAVPHSAEAQPSVGHCAEPEQQPEEREGAMIDCAIACAAMPASLQVMAGREALVAPLPKVQAVRFRTSSRPEAATPPPRMI